MGRNIGYKKIIVFLPHIYVDDFWLLNTFTAVYMKYPVNKFVKVVSQ